MPFTEETYKETLASAMAVRRRQLQETQEDVARAIDVPLSVYRGWETGRSAPRGAAWFRLCEHFHWPHPLSDTNNLRYAETASDLLEWWGTHTDNHPGVEVDDSTGFASVGVS